MTTTAITITPSTGTIYGGTLVTISAQGVGLGSQGLKFGSINAEIIDRTADSIIVRTSVGTVGTVSITTDNGVALGTFDYVENGSATITLDIVEYSVKGEPVEITFSKEITDDITFFLDEMEVGNATISATKYSFTMPVHTPGLRFENAVSLIRYSIKNYSIF